MIEKLESDEIIDSDFLFLRKKLINLVSQRKKEHEKGNRGYSLFFWKQRTEKDYRFRLFVCLLGKELVNIVKIMETDN